MERVEQLICEGDSDTAETIAESILATVAKRGSQRDDETVLV
jgi:hypothetical protein